MKHYLKILRLNVCLLGVFGVLVGAFVSDYLNYTNILIAALVAFLVCGAGNTINDYFDYEIDKINKPHRPIASGKISRKNSLIYAGILYVLAIIFVSFLNKYNIILALFNIFITLIYSWKLKKLPLIGNFCPSWLAASSFMFGSLLTAKLNVTVLLLFIMAFSANTGREIAKAIEDIKGDMKMGYKTLPIVTNQNFAKWVTIIFIFFAIIFSPMPYILNLLSANYIYIVTIADLIFGASCFILIFNPAKSQKIMKIGMFIAIIAFILGTKYF